MKFYGSQLWYNAKANSEKLAITMKTDAVGSFVEMLEKSDLNYYGYENEKIGKISVNRDDFYIVKSLVGDTVAQAMHIEEIKKSYIPPEKNVFGTIDYKYIPRKTKKYLTAESSLEQKAILRTAELLTGQGIKFSGRAYEDKVTLTFNESDLESATAIYNSVLSNLTAISESSRRSEFEKMMDEIVSSLNNAGFNNEYLEQNHDENKNDSILNTFTLFKNVDYDDYALSLNPYYTEEQNADILNRLKDVYTSGGFDILQPSKAESELYKIKEQYDADIQLRSYLADYNFNAAQEAVIRNIVYKEKTVLAILNEIDETFNPEEIEQLYNLYLTAVNSKRKTEALKKIEKFIRNHHFNQFLKQNTPYNNAFFVDEQSDRVKWIYFNPDSYAGGQYVCNEVTFKEILLAKEFTSTPEEFFDYIGQSCCQTLADIGTEYFFEVEKEFTQNPNFTDCSDVTMGKLAKIAEDSGTLILGKSEIGAVLLEQFTNDNELREIFRNNNSDFDTDVEKRVDDFVSRLEQNKERIQGYSRFDVNTFCSEYKYSAYSGKIKEEIIGTITHDLNEAFSALESTKEKAQEIGMPFVDKFVNDDYEFNPYEYDGSMTPEDFEKAQELNLNQEHLEENAVSEPEIVWAPIPETENDEGRITSYSALYDGRTYFISENSDGRFVIERRFGNIIEPIDNKASNFPTREYAEKFFYNLMKEKEQYFLDYENFIGRAVKNTLAYDEIENLGFIFFEDGYIDKHQPSEKAIYGLGSNSLTEPKVFELSKRLKNGENISDELVKAFMYQRNDVTLDIEHLDYKYNVQRNEEGFSFILGNAEHRFTTSELAESYLNMFKNEYEDIINLRTVEDLAENIPDLSSETAEQLLNSFKGAVVSGWQGDEVKENRIKRALYEILGDKDKTEKAFISIADMAYNYKPVTKNQNSFEIISNSKEVKVTENNNDVAVQSGIKFGLFGNGITVYDITKEDKEGHDYLTVAHISPEGTVKFYVDDISESDRNLINSEADKQRAEFTEKWNRLPMDERYQQIHERANITELVALGKDKLPKEEFVKKYEKSIIYKSEDFPVAGPEPRSQENKTVQAVSKSPAEKDNSETEAPTKNTAHTITITTVNVLASEHQLIEQNKTYTLAEFDRLIERLNYDWISNRQQEIKDFGGIDEAFVLGGDYQATARTDFVINLPDGQKLTESIDIGSSYGGLLDYMNKIEKYKDLIPVLEQAIDSEVLGTVEMPSSEEYRHINFPEKELSEKQKTEPAKTVSDIGKNILNAEKVKLTEISQSDYRITDNHIGEGKKSERFKNNIAAIRTLKEIEAENRLATPEEQDILAKYVGWGGLSDCFKEKHPSYNQLRHYLTEDEFNAARASTLTAFYTPPIVMQSMYKALGNMGFKEGKILEPSCGIGNFIGTIPEEMRSSKVHAVELDDLSGQIAKQLYPNADIKITGFEKTKFNDNSFDVAVGNVPFGEISVRDKQYDKYNWRIHNYFFAKSLDKVRPGGVVAFITSRYTLDSKNSSFREYLSERSDFLGAIRLPNNTFSKAAGTEVTSDIIFLQKRDTPLEKIPEWVETAENENGLKINKYFVDNPNMILGNLTETSSRYGRTDITVEPIEGAELSEQLDKAIENIQGTIPERKLKKRDIEVETPIAEGDSVTEELRNFSFYVNKEDGKVYFKQNDTGTLWKKGAESKSYEDRAKAFIAVRDCTREVLDAMVNDCSDEELAVLQSKLNTLYDSFYKMYGLVHSKFNKSLFSDDISYQLVASLEDKYNDKELVSKSALFTKRTIKPPVPVTCVDTAQEALTISIAEKGRVDLDFMSELYENDKDTILNELKGKIFPVPELSTDDEIVYQDSSEYLSGDIRKKIDNAKVAAESNPMLYSANIKALEEVLPEPLKAGDIDVKIGASWIDPKYYQQFMYETFKTPVDNRADSEKPWYRRRRAKIELKYSEVGNSYHIENKGLDTSVFTTKTFGLKAGRANAYCIFENLLNLRDTKIYKTVYDEHGEEKRVIDTEATKLAASKADKIKKAFKEWIFKDPERRETLVKKYNDMYNSIRPREFDGSGLTFPGMNAEITLRPHQKNAIAHALYGGNTLFAHSVGAGKTYEMIATAMESKRLGLCSKSLMVVPNHLTEQIGDDFQKLYPNANVLVATKDDFTKQKRRYLVSKIATGDYDAVIIGHSQLGKIPLSKERQKAYIQEEIAELVNAIEEMKAVEERSFSVKDAEKRKDNLEKQLQKLQTEKDDIVTFEELGIDKIFVDEAHEFKNLYTPTKLNNVSGVSHTASQKASDLYMKCRYLDEKTSGRGVTFATGTPISNSVTELFTMQRYLQHELLKEKNLSHFDQWITLFGEQVTDYQIDPTGKKYKPKTRISNYSNMTELMSMFKCTADIKTAEMMKLDVPDCKLIVENVPPTELQQELVNELSDRADAVESGMVEPTEDNFLKITSDGRKVGLDPRLIDPNLEDNPETKLNRCVRNVLRIHKETAEDKLTQLIFCDLGVPNAKNKGSSEKADNTETVSIAEQESFEDTGKFCIYDDIKKKLIEGGVPEKEIAFIHDAKTDKAKSELFEKCRKGEVRVLLGSTPKMGTGTNIQNKLVAMHDLDVPWRPSDLEQRRGRMVRQGNENKQVELYRYVTKGTFDAYSYQTLENKDRYISQLYTSNQRTCEDVDQQSLSYAEIKTLCTGDERLKELMTLDNEVSNLLALKRGHTNTVYEMQDKVKRFSEKKDILKNVISGIEKDINLCNSLPRDRETGGIAFTMTIGSKTFADKTEAAKVLKNVFENAVPKLSKGEVIEIGSMHGFPITVKFSVTAQEFVATVNGTSKYTVPFSEASQSTNIKRLCNVFDGMESKLADKKESIVRIDIEVKEAEKIINTPFEHEQELADKTQRRNTLKNELQTEQREKAGQKSEKKTYHFSVANLRRNAQKCKEESKDYDKSKDKDKSVIG